MPKSQDSMMLWPCDNVREPQLIQRQSLKILRPCDFILLCKNVKMQGLPYLGTIGYRQTQLDMYEGENDIKLHTMAGVNDCKNA